MYAPKKLSYERLRLDKINNYNIPPLVAELLEEAPGHNIWIASDALARGCGHHTDAHFASGLCPACIIRNSLDSGTNMTHLRSPPERWVSDYAQKYCRSNWASVARDVNGPRWVKSLIGDIAVFPSAVPEWSGLRDTPRERVAAAQRFAEFRAFECDL